MDCSGLSMIEDPTLWQTLMTPEGMIIIGAAVLAGLFGVFNKIFDLIVDIWYWLIPFEVVDEFDEGVVLRWGVFNRKVVGGFRWMWPFGIEELLSDTVVRTTSYLEVQSLTSKDGKAVNLSPILIYKIGNIKRWLLEVDDAEDALHDVTYGILDEMVSMTKFEYILKPEFMEEVTALVQDEAVRWGARVEAVKLSDRVNSRSMRLWTGME